MRSDIAEAVELGVPFLKKKFIPKEVFDFKSQNGSAQVREKKDKLLFSNQLARLKQVTNKECQTFWQMLNKQTFKHPGCFENTHTFHLGVEKFKFQGEECKWCSEDFSRKRHKQQSYEDAINKQMEHFLVKCPVAQALWKKLQINKELSWDSLILPSSDTRELIQVDNYLIFQKKYSRLRRDKDFDWKTIPISSLIYYITMVMNQITHHCYLSEWKMVLK